MKKQLNLTERMTLELLLPNKDTFGNLILRKDVLGKIKINQKDLARFKIKEQETGLVTWNEKMEAKVGPKTIDFTALENTYIKSVFQKLKKDKKSIIPVIVVDLYERFK